MIWFISGSAALALAAIGVLLPLLPTTPFALLAVLAYGKSVPRFAASLERSCLFGPTLVNRHTKGAIAPRQKAVALAMMAGVFGVSVVTSLAVPILGSLQQSVKSYAKLGTDIRSGRSEGP